ncbi:hypothetical protein DFH09DRAFT_1372799 [Mycena vulgaris]|nr:hypothetical protein DFH09DRAFT_1372799 [Mycena vulgaris]
MASPVHCAVPFYGDPGQPDGSVPGQKLYLVSGRNVRFPGAYVSWPSADAQYKSVSNATVKSYRSWTPLESAWFAGCERGEHTHSSNTEGPDLQVEGLTSPPCALAPSLVLSSPVSFPPAYPRAPTSAKPPTSGKPALTASTASSFAAPRRGVFPSPSPHRPSDGAPAAVIPGKMAYAVRHNDQGVVFGDYESARALYHGLQARGEVPCLASTPSLTDGICFVEGFSMDGRSREALQRQEWVEEERRARAQHIVDAWGNAMETWRLGRSGAWISKSDSDEDESSVSTQVDDTY